jgi:hypothetical protein
MDKACEVHSDVPGACNILETTLNFKLLFSFVTWIIVSTFEVSSDND